MIYSKIITHVHYNSVLSSIDYGIFYYTSANVYEPNRKRTKSELEALLSSRDVSNYYY